MGGLVGGRIEAGAQTFLKGGVLIRCWRADENVLDGAGHILGQGSYDVCELGNIGCDLLQNEDLLGLHEPDVGFLVPVGGTAWHKRRRGSGSHRHQT